MWKLRYELGLTEVLKRKVLQMKGKWRRGKLRSGKRLRVCGKVIRGKEKMDSGAEVKEEEEEDITLQPNLGM